MDDDDRTASLMTPARLAQLKERPKAAASPAAWLDQLAADAGSGHVRRLADLRRALEAQVRERSWRELGLALENLATLVAGLDFALLEPKGWLARATGKGRQGAAEFLAQADRVAGAGEELQDTYKALHKRLQAQDGVAGRTLLEFDTELKAIEKIIDQGARWLQDMRNQLKAREAQGGDAAAQKSMQEDAARCELLVERLKQLRAASSAAQQLVERCRAAGPRRAAVLEQVQQALDSEWRDWQRRLARVTAEAKESGTVAQGLDKVRRTGEALQAALRQAVQDCAGLQAGEEALAGEVAALHEPLQAAA